MSGPRLSGYAPDSLGSYSDRPEGQEWRLAVSGTEESAAVTEGTEQEPSTTNRRGPRVELERDVDSPPSLSFTAALPISAETNETSSYPPRTATETTPSYSLNRTRWRSCPSLSSIDSHNVGVYMIATVVGTVTGALIAAAFDMKTTAIAAGAGIGGGLSYGITAYVTRRYGSHHNPEQDLSHSRGPSRSSIPPYQSPSEYRVPPPWMIK